MHPKMISLFGNIAAYGNIGRCKIMYSYIPKMVYGDNLRTKLHEAGHNKSDFSLKIVPPAIKMVTENLTVLSLDQHP